MLDPKLKALIESPEFKQYQRELQAPVFNPFEVLQVADFEIRHSNVLAWLLRPDETHGIGGGFLRALVEHLTRGQDARAWSGLKTLPPGFDDKNNVEVSREDYRDGHYADVTIGFKAQRVLLIIENKVGWSSGEAWEQLRAYQTVFGEKYKSHYDHFPGVLLTTSREADEAGSDAVHLSWKKVAEIIRTLLDDRANFTGDHVRAFMERYVDVIDERLVRAGSSTVELLQEHHRSICERLQEEPALLDELDPERRRAVERLIEYLQGRPAKLRDRVKEYLKHRDDKIGTWTGGKRGVADGGWLCLHWYGVPSARELNVDECVGWRFWFGRHVVEMELGNLYRRTPDMERVWEHLQEVPVDPGRLDRYPMENHIIYRHHLLKGHELSGPFDKVSERLHKRLNEFFGPGGDYQRIERYFKCLAFDPRGPEHLAEDEAAGGEPGTD